MEDAKKAKEKAKAVAEANKRIAKQLAIIKDKEKAEREANILAELASIKKDKKTREELEAAKKLAKLEAATRLAKLEAELAELKKAKADEAKYAQIAKETREMLRLQPTKSSLKTKSAYR